MRTAVNVVLVLAIQLGLLGYMIWDRMLILQAGVPVELSVEPVDPRSLFRGDYVILTYKISQLNTNTLEGDDTFERNDLVYVELVKGLEEWEAVALYQELPATPATDNQVFVKGRVHRAYLRSNVAAPVTDLGTDTPQIDRPDGESDQSGLELSIKYGVESYFVPEGEGRALEDARNEDRMSVLLAVAKNGTAAIKQLIVDGEVYHEEGLF